MTKENNTKISGIIKGASLVGFEDAGPEHQGLKILCGTVVKDFKGRFDAGNWFISSKVEEIRDDLIYTLNSIYKVEGEVEHIMLPKSVASELFKGIDPRMIRGMLDEGYRFVSEEVGAVH